MVPQTSELFFTRNIANPRDCDIIGEHLGKPFFCRFETSPSHPSSHHQKTHVTYLHLLPSHSTPPSLTFGSFLSKVYRNDDGVVAVFDWEPNNRLGRLTTADQQVPMMHLVCRGSKQNSRAFRYPGDNLLYEWRRLPDNFSYDLHNDRDGRIASFTRFSQAQHSAVGPTSGLLQTTALEPAFLLQSILALSINRWIDSYGC